MREWLSRTLLRYNFAQRRSNNKGPLGTQIHLMEMSSNRPQLPKFLSISFI